MTLNEQTLPALMVEGIGNSPGMEFRLRADGAITYRYCVDDDTYPGFDGLWRVMTESERRAHMLMDRKIAEWLRSLE